MRRIAETGLTEEYGDQKGSALIITLLVVTVLVALVTEFAYEVYIDTASTNNWKHAQQASFIARSGQALGSVYIDELNDSSYTTEQKTEVPVNRDFGAGNSLTVTIEDENAKFKLNTLIEPNGRTDETALSSLKNLCEYLNINPDLALLIADWIDPDSEPRLPDSEDIAKNAPLWSIEEIRLAGKMSGEDFDKLSPFITVFGTGEININTAGIPVLLSLGEGMNETLAKRIVNYRESLPFEEPNQLQRVPGLEAIGIDNLGRITVKSSTYRVTSKATVNGITRIIESVIKSNAMIDFWKEV